jgi:ribosomal protein S18 acetylase RimI-like enzyme
MSLETRLLRAGDEPALGKVAPGLFDHPIDPGAARAFLADARHHIAVALDGDTVVAFASGIHYFHPDKPAPEMFVNEVGVAASHRRRGLGRAVVERLLDAARRTGCREAWVLTEPSNTAAMRLFASAWKGAGARQSVLYAFDL